MRAYVKVRVRRSLVPFEGVNAYGGGFLASLSLSLSALSFASFSFRWSLPEACRGSSPWPLRRVSSCSLLRRARASTGLFWFIECRVCRAGVARTYMLSEGDARQPARRRLRGRERELF